MISVQIKSTTVIELLNHCFIYFSRNINPLAGHLNIDVLLKDDDGDGAAPKLHKSLNKSAT